MKLHEELLDLEPAVNKLSQGVSALGLMSMGLDREEEPYADGFTALFQYMRDADQEVHQHLNHCLEMICHTHKALPPPGTALE